MRVLALRFDERVRRDVSRFDQLVEPAQERGSVLREPASEPDIARAEERLGVRLPASYRWFLLVSDGAYASALGAELVTEHDLRHGLLSVSELQRTVDGDEIGVRVWCGDLAEPYDPADDISHPPAPGAPEHVGDYRPYQDGLLITHIFNGSERLALVPRPGAAEWELWDFHWEGAYAHASFADFLEWFVTRSDERPRPEHADLYVESFLSGRSFTLGLLAEVGDPRAVELGRARLQAGSEDTRIPAVLGQMGDPDSIPVLRETYGRSERWAMRAAALGALMRLGADDAAELLAQAASDDDADLRRWATWKLGRT